MMFPLFFLVPQAFYDALVTMLHIYTTMPVLFVMTMLLSTRGINFSQMHICLLCIAAWPKISIGVYNETPQSRFQEKKKILRSSIFAALSITFWDLLPHS